MKNVTFDDMMNWNLSQILLELDVVQTLVGIIPQPRNRADVIRAHQVHLRALSNRASNYMVLIQKLTPAAQTPEEARMIVSAEDALKRLKDAISTANAMTQVELSRRENDKPLG